MNDFSANDRQSYQRSPFFICKRKASEISL